MSRNSGSPLWASKPPPYQNTSWQSQLDPWLPARTMGNSHSQETQTGAHDEPERLMSSKSAHRMGQNILPHEKGRGTTKAGPQPKEVNTKDDKPSEGDEDDESDEWSDWNAMAQTVAKRNPSPDRELGDFTYETSSGEGEDESQEEDQISRVRPYARLKSGRSREPGYPRLPVSAPTRSEDHGVRASNKTGEPHSSALSSRRGMLEAVASNYDAAVNNSHDDGFPAEVVQNEHVQARTKQKIQRTPAEQHLCDKRHPEPPSVRVFGRQDEGTAPVPIIVSDRDISSPSSSSDLVQDSSLGDGRHLQSMDLKRKRSSADGRISSLRGQPTRKRRRRSIFSPPTSVPPEVEGSTGPSSGLKAIQGRFKINDPVAKQKPTLDQTRSDQESGSTRVKPLPDNTSLKHPMSKPSPLKALLRSHATDIATQSGKAVTALGSRPRRRSSKETGTRKASYAHLVEDSSNDEAPMLQQTSRSIFTSRKGKSRAKPAAKYSSPPKARDRAINLSTSQKAGRKARPVAPKPFAADDTPSDHEVEQRSTEDSGSGSYAGISDGATDESAEGSSTPKKLTCRTCNRMFRAEEQLRIHKKNNGTHARLYECGECRDEFDVRGSLLRHQSQHNHPRETFHAGRSGPFSENEIRKLERFMVDYCNEHGIEETVFRQMMTDSSRRGRGATLSWPGVTSVEFLNDYYDVLPERAHKSMQRYKERNFQNLDHKKEWTEEDDKLLLQLVDELGQKWTEIGLRLSRTQDSVTSRYKKRLKDNGAARSGDWSFREDEALGKVIEDMKDELGLDKTSETDANIVWTEVSRRMGAIRTAHQCSTHWHRVLRRKRQNKRRSTEGRRNFKSKEVVSSDDDNERANMEDKPCRERSVGVAITKKTKRNGDEVKVRDPSESDINEQSIQQDDKGIESGPYAAIEWQISPELGSSDWGEQDVTRSSSKPHSYDVAENANSGDDLNEPVERTADEWERILAAEESEVMLETRSKKIKGPAANSKTSRNPITKKTPGRVMALSQAFEATQAPTSVLRHHTPVGLEILASNSSRPSPDIRLRLRRDLLQDLGTSQHQDSRQSPIASSDENEITRDVGMEGVDGSSGESDQDTDIEDATESSHDSRKPNRMQAEFLEGAMTGDLDGGEEHISAQPALGHSIDREESRPVVKVEAETSEYNDASEEDEQSDNDSEGSEQTSESDDGSAATEGSDNEDETVDSNDGMVMDTRNDFMANIKESALQSQMQSPEVLRRTIQESEDESD